MTTIYPVSWGRETINASIVLEYVNYMQLNLPRYDWVCAFWTSGKVVILELLLL